MPHDLGRVVATSQILVRTPQPQLIPLSDGRLFVADPTTRLLWLLDASLGNPRIVLDSVAGRKNSFTPRSWIVPFRGDSVLYFDAVSRGFVVIGPDGGLGRSMAPPDGTPASGPLNPTRPGSLTLGYESHTPSFSAPLGVVYKISAPSPVSRGVYSRPAPGEPDKIIESEDSSYVVRMDVETRATDTLTQIARGSVSARSLGATGAPIAQPWEPAPFPFADEFVVTSDGSVAIFRAREYRIQWVGADGKLSSGPRLPYPSAAIGDAERQRIVDSINATRRARYDSTIMRRAADSASSGGARGAARGASGVSVSSLIGSRLVLVDSRSVPDFYPPTSGTRAVLADADNNVWIRLRSADQNRGGVIWEVINRHGELVDRVRIPEGQTVVGFARGGFVYLLVRDGGLARIQKVAAKPSPVPPGR